MAFIASGFLTGEHSSFFDAVRTLVLQISEVTGGSVFFYTAPNLNGRSAVALVIANCPDVQPGALAPMEHVAMLEMALAAEQEVAGLGRLAAGAVRAHDRIEGVLLTEVPPMRQLSPARSAADGWASPQGKCTLTRAAMANGATVLVPSIRLWASVLGERIEKIQFREEARCHALFAHVSGVAELAKLLEKEIARFLMCESSRLYIVDEQQEELWTPCCSGHSRGTVIDFLDWKDADLTDVIERLRDTGKFDIALSESCEVAVPVIYFPRGGHCPQLLAMLKASRSNVFTKAEIAWLRTLATASAPCLHNMQSEIIFARIQVERAQEGDDDGLSNSFERLLLYYNHGPRQTVTPEGMPQLGRAISKGITQDMSKGTRVNIRNRCINYWDLTDSEEFTLMQQSMDSFDVFKELKFPVHALLAYFRAVKQGYRAVPYHNFKHAISTVHHCYMFASSMDKLAVTKATDIVALMIGAMVHDVGHRGKNNAFEIASRSELALRYNDTSPLENHHCALAFQIALNGERTNIFENMNSTAYLRIRERMVSGIIGTDMKFHGQHLKALGSLAAAEGDEEGLDVQSALFDLVLHAADIANPAMPSQISERWGDAIAREMSEQVAAETELGIPITAFMVGLEEPVTRAKSQLGFMDFVVSPLFTPLTRDWLRDDGSIRANMEENRSNICQIIDSSDSQATKRKSRLSRSTSRLSRSTSSRLSNESITRQSS